jgi:putative ABC transport system permease protein
MALLAGLAAATVLLAAIGIHGLIATTVTERTREIGIRLALGATAGHTIRTIALPALALAAAGIAAGLALSAFAVTALRSFVWGVSTSDPLTFAVAPAILLIVATAAALLPARRILRVDPAQTLRAE